MLAIEAAYRLLGDAPFWVRSPKGVCWLKVGRGWSAEEVALELAATLGRHAVPGWVHQPVHFNSYPRELMVRNHVQAKFHLQFRLGDGILSLMATAVVVS